jgi:hypothetical protein
MDKGQEMQEADLERLKFEAARKKPLTTKMKGWKKDE